MRLASSWMVIVSGIVTSRAIFSFGSLSRWPLRRWTRRRNEATERSRTSSAVSAVTRVRRPRRFSPPLRVGFGAGAGRSGTAGPRRAGGAPRPRRPRAPGARRCRALPPWSRRSPKRFLATSSALRLVSSSCLRRRFFLALARFGGRAFGAFDFFAAAADARLFLGALALFASRSLASASACARALRSSSVSVRSTTPEVVGERGRRSGGLPPPGSCRSRARRLRFGAARAVGRARARPWPRPGRCGA